MITRNVGLSIIGLKGGRIRPEQSLDYATGFSDFCQIGDYLSKDKPIAIIHAQSEQDFEQAERELRLCIRLTDKPLKKLHNPIIKKIK